MDIFERGEQYGFLADYYDLQTGYIYKLQDYGKRMREAKETGKEFDRQLVVTDTYGQVIGTITDTRN